MRRTVDLAACGSETRARTVAETVAVLPSGSEAVACSLAVASPRAGSAARTVALIGRLRVTARVTVAQTVLAPSGASSPSAGRPTSAATAEITTAATRAAKPSPGGRRRGQGDQEEGTYPIMGEDSRRSRPAQSCDGPVGPRRLRGAGVGHNRRVPVEPFAVLAAGEEPPLDELALALAGELRDCAMGELRLELPLAEREAAALGAELRSLRARLN